MSSLVQKLRSFYLRGGFCLLVELHWEGYVINGDIPSSSNIMCLSPLDIPFILNQPTGAIQSLSWDICLCVCHFLNVVLLSLTNVASQIS